MAHVVRHVNPDASGGAEDGTSQSDGYLSLNAWNAAEATDLVADTDTHEVQCGASSDSADTTAVGIGFGWDCDATYKYKITAYTGNEAVKDGWKTDRYRLEVTDDDAFTFDTITGYETVEKIQIRSVYSSSLGFDVFKFAVMTAGDGEVTLDGLRIRGENAESVCSGLRFADADIVAIVKNCIVEFCDRWLVEVSDCSSLKLYNCVFAHQDYSSGYGVDCDSNTVTIKNCAVFDTNDDFANTGSATLDYNASDDGDGTNSVGPSGSDWDNEFNDPANGDYTALTGGNIEDAGVGPGTDSDVPSTDIDGDSRSGSTCDIGADEIAGGGGVDISHTASSIEFTPGTHTYSAGASYTHTTTSIEYTPGSHAIGTSANYNHTTTSIEYTPGTHTYSTGANYSHTTTSIEYTPGSHTISTGANYDHSAGLVEFTPGSHTITASTGVDISHTATSIEYTSGSHTFTAITFHAAPAKRTYTIEAESRVYKIPPESREYVIEEETREVDIR